MSTIRERIEQAKAQEYLTVEQLALLFQYHPKSIYRMVEQNKIPGVCRIGRNLRFRTRAVLTWGYQSLEARDIRPSL